ncbi:hypothetical protein DSL92_04155 [Billgrantia gudaonensis]|uniref:Uncharacterized protein n=1 Tax=Billgrantia gudaonensis TaxID=376427 RepID=A0A3S0NHG3_9GAMM|nr:hypothetical protein DSL92_04155 [Halomonas gudaonensis]
MTGWQPPLPGGSSRQGNCAGGAQRRRPQPDRHRPGPLQRINDEYGYDVATFVAGIRRDG